MCLKCNRNSFLCDIRQINEVRKLIGPALNKFPTMCSDASILRFLRARNWHTKRSAKMLKEALIWRLENKPNMIRWVRN